MEEEQDSNQNHSDNLNFEIKQSQIPYAGMGLYSKRNIEQGEIIAEYRGKVIDSTYAWSHPFIWEDKMVYVNERYTIIGLNIASKLNDIVNFDVYSFSQQDIDMIDQQQRFPTVAGLQYNTDFVLNEDKVFLKASKDIKQDEELFLDYSFHYWKGFYDLYKENTHLFFEHWQNQKAQCKKEYDQWILSDTETLKIKVDDEEVYCEQAINISEYILECKGLIVPIDVKNDGLCLKIKESLKLCVDKLSQKLLKQTTEDTNCMNTELIKMGDKYMFVATDKISQGSKIITDLRSVKEYLI